MEWLKRNGVSLLLAILLGWMLLEARGLSQQVFSLENRLDQQYAALHSEINNISSDVTRGVEEANRVVQELRVTGDGVDRAAQQLLARATVRLRTYQADTAVTLVMTQNGAVTEIPMTLGDGGIFTAPVSLPAEMDMELTFAAIVDNDGTLVREGETWVSLGELLPITASSWGGTRYSVSDGQLELESVSVNFEDTATYETIRVKQPMFRLYRNGKLEQSLAGQVDEEKLLTENQITYNGGDWTLLPIQVHDEIRVTAFCTDENGLGYEFALQELTIGPDGSTIVVHGEIASPTLHWS